MNMLKKLKLKLKQTIRNVSMTIKSIITAGANLVGLRLIERRWDYTQLAIAGWCFLVGLPLGFVFLGSIFSVAAWAAIIFITLILSNLDHALEQLCEIGRKKKTVSEQQCLFTCA